MQWSPDRNGGFSRADPAELTLPTVQDPLYGFSAINVEAQSRDPHSLLNWLKRMLAVRGKHRAFGRGTQRFLRPQNRKVLAYLREFDGEPPVLCVANVSRTAQAVELDLSEFAGFTPVEMSGNTPFPTIGQLTYLLTLPPYGFYWFQLCDSMDGPEWSSATAGIEPEHHTFVLREGVAEILSPRNREMLEREVLPPYIPQRRWFQGKDAVFRSAVVTDVSPLPSGDAVLAEIEVTTEAGAVAYALPLAIVWEDEATGPFAHQLAMARVRRGRMVGRLTDGFSTPGFIRGVLAALRDNAPVASGDGELRFEAVGDLALHEDPELQWLSAEQSNSSLVIGRQVVLKLLRRITPGVHPEAEMSRALTERDFDATPAMLGEVVRVAADGERRTLMVAQAFVHNQGDGWSWSLDYLKRAVDELIADPAPDETALEGYASFAETFGQRVAQMHAALARPSEDPSFAPETAVEADIGAWAVRVKKQLGSAFDLLPARVRDDPTLEATASDLLRRKDDLLGKIDGLASSGAGSIRTRIHGDLHLGQILVTGGDVAIIDFEGEPTRTLEERRAKDSPLRDVAGVLRSFDYAAAMAPRSTPVETEEVEAHVGALLTRFRTLASDAFLRGYAEGGGETGALLDLFLLEKAAYELAYEAANRPTWLRVPLQGLAALTGRLLQEADEARG